MKEKREGYCKKNNFFTDSIINNRVSEQTNTLYNGEFDPGSG